MLFASTQDDTELSLNETKKEPSFLVSGLLIGLTVFFMFSWNIVPGKITKLTFFGIHFKIRSYFKL